MNASTYFPSKKLKVDTFQMVRVLKYCVLLLTNWCVEGTFFGNWSLWFSQDMGEKCNPQHKATASLYATSTLFRPAEAQPCLKDIGLQKMGRVLQTWTGLCSPAPSSLPTPFLSLPLPFSNTSSHHTTSGLGWALIVTFDLSRSRFTGFSWATG